MKDVKAAVLALPRQNLPQLRTNAPADNPCAQGGYELVAPQGEAKVSLFASGSGAASPDLRSSSQCRALPR